MLARTPLLLLLSLWSSTTLAEFAVKSSGSESFEFKPLFPHNASLVYAIDGSTADASQKISFWLEYPEVHVDNTAVETSQIALLFTGLMGSAAGQTGCKERIGPQCVERLEDVLKKAIVQRANNLESNVTALYDGLKDVESTYSVAQLSCPDDFFTDSPLTPSAMVDGNLVENPFAVEATQNNTIGEFSPELLPSGNSSYLYAYPVTRNRSYEEQIAKLGVGIIARFPIVIDPVYDFESKQDVGGPNITYDDIQMEFVCVNAGNITSVGTVTKDSGGLSIQSHSVWITALVGFAALYIAIL